MKEERIDVGDGLTVDIAPHKALGMTILRDEDILEREEDCKGCTYLDEYFGDCCHPKSGGCLDLTWALNECLRKGYKFRRS